MRIKLNRDMNGYKAGHKLDIEDKNGVPTDRFWRSRLNDAKIDSCIEIIQTKEKSKSQKNEVSKDDNA